MPRGNLAGGTGGLLVAVSILAGIPAPVAQLGAPTASVIGAIGHDVSPPLRLMRPALPIHVGAGDPDTEPLPTIPRTRPITDPVVQRAVGAGGTTATVHGFPGQPNLSGFLPADPNGAAGPHVYVQVVNDQFAVYDKAGDRILGPEAVDTLWTGFGGSCEHFGQGDPIVLYDELADRFLIGEFAFPYGQGPYDECIALSKTGNPTGAWYRYAYQLSDTVLPDYPKIGVWPDAYAMTTLRFDASGTWKGAGVVAFDRAAMLHGRPGSVVQFEVPPDASTGLLPADLDGPTPPPAGSPEYLVGLDTAQWGQALDLWRLHLDWSDPSADSLTGPASIPTAPFDTDMCGYQRDCVPQPGTPQGLDASSYRPMYRLAYRNFGNHESLVVAQTVDADGTDHAGVRWYEIRDPGGTPAVFQQGTYAPTAANRFVPSVAMNGHGDIAIGYTVSGPGTYPSIRFTGRLASDPLGELPQGEGTIAAGTASQLDPSGRWGDYSSMSVDPADDCTFWYTNEFYSRANPELWLTRIGSIRFPSCRTGTASTSTTIAARRRGGRLVARGRVSPADPGAPMEVVLSYRSVLGQIKTTKWWRTLDASGRYRARVPAPDGTRCELMAVFPGDTGLDRSSAAARVHC